MKNLLTALFAWYAICANGLTGNASECHREYKTRLLVEECLVQKVDAAEKMLQTYITAVDKRYAQKEPRAVSLLAESQTAWSRSKEAFCRSAAEEFSGGSASNALYLRCVLQQTERRTHDVWEWHLTYGDSTPPDLPEPIYDIDGK